MSTTTIARLAAGSLVSALVLTAGAAVGAGANDAPAGKQVSGQGLELPERSRVLLGTGAGGGAGGGGGGGGSAVNTME